SHTTRPACCRAQALLPVPMGPGGPRRFMKTRCFGGPMWRGHSCLPSRHSCRDAFGAATRTVAERVFEAAASRLFSTRFGVPGARDVPREGFEDAHVEAF